MAVCFDADNNKYVYCSSHLSTYIAVGVIVPIGILLIVALVYFYLRCRQRQLRQDQQQTYMATIIPIHNSDRASQSYPYPPQYTSMIRDSFDKPPSYEQTIQETMETNNDAVDYTRPPVPPSIEESSRH